MANVSSAINKSQVLLNKYKNFTNVKKFYIELIKLKNELDLENKTNYKLYNLISYIEEFLMKLQTGCSPLSITTQTKYGNLIEKILSIARGKNLEKKKPKNKNQKK